jgi:hypothetical protein
MRPLPVVFMLSNNLGEKLWSTAAPLEKDKTFLESLIRRMIMIVTATIFLLGATMYLGRHFGWAFVSPNSPPVAINIHIPYTAI